MIFRATLGSTQIDVIVADITTLTVDAIVNAANNSLLGGGGVDGAIHRKAGPGLLEECRTLGGCATGEAKLTGGHKLPATHVIHAVGPVWTGGSGGEAQSLASCYTQALEIAAGRGLASIAFPAISQGVYGYPPVQATNIAVTTVLECLHSATTSLTRIVFCCFSQPSAELHVAALVAAGLTPRPVNRL